MASDESLPPSPGEGALWYRRDVLKAAAALVAAGVALPAVFAGDARSQSDRPGEPLTPHVSMEAAEVLGEVDLARTGSWHQDGLQRTDAGLELRPTRLAIVDKRAGGRIEPDPPVNLYGTHLQVAGDFSVTAVIAGDAPVSLQLYGQPPLRFDDFRFERARLECACDEGVLTVRVWDGSQQEPTTTRFQFVGSPAERTVEAQRVGEDLLLVINGALIGRVPAGRIFDGGAVWFGLNSETGPALVRSLVARPLNGHRLEVVDTTTLRVEAPLADGGLQRNVRKAGFRLGAAVALGPLVSEPQYAELFLGGEIGSVTTENVLKPQSVQPSERLFTFAQADAIVELAERHGLAVHGHTLVYDKATPQWMQELPYATEAEKQRVREVLVEHVRTVVGHFRGRIQSWDVVNEALSGFGSDVQFTDSIWYRALGEEYLDIAFQAAHEADPGALLFINDYGLETNAERREFMLQLVQRLQARGVPIHGVGIEGHVYEIPRDTIYPQVLRQLMDTLARFRLLARVSELDVTGAHGTEAQAQQYASALQVCLQAQNCPDFTAWGLDDGHGSTASVRGNRLVPGNALPYTADFRPKAARTRMQDTLRADAA